MTPNTPQNNLDQKLNVLDKLKGTSVDQNDINELKAVLENKDDLFKGFLRKKLEKNIQNKMEDIFKDLNIDTIKNLYKNEKLSPQEKQNLEKLFELLNVESDNEKAKQREINAVIELSKFEQDKLVSLLIQEKYNEGKYQEAMDIAIVLSQSKDSQDSIEGFAYIKQILKSTQDSDVLIMIRDQKVTSSQRKDWVKKMDDNLHNASIQFQNEFYKDMSTKTSGTLELDTTKKTKEVSEKKAIREIDEELGDILKHVNESSAFAFIENNYEEIKKATLGNKWELDKLITKDYLLTKNYIPKKGETVSNRELKAIKNLFLLRSNYFDWTWKNEDAQKNYNRVKNAKISGVQLNEVRQANIVVDKIKINETDPSTAIKILLGDINRDGNIRNIGNGIRNREWVDQGTIFGGQIVKMYENALTRFGAEAVAINVESVIKELNWQSNFEIKPKSEEGIFNALKANPTALIAFRKKLFSEPDSGMHMFYLGKEYASVKVDEIKKRNEDKKEIEKFLQTIGGIEILNETETKLQNKQKDALETAYQNLLNIKKSDQYKKLKQEEQSDLDKLLTKISPNNLETFLASPEMKAQRKEFAISGIWAAFSAVKYSWEMNYGAGAGMSIDSSTINTVLQKTKFLDSASASIGLYGDKSGLNFWMGLSTSGSVETSVSSRLFYGAGVWWSPLRPSQIWLNVPVGHEWQINRKSLEDSLDGKSTQYLGVVGSFGLGVNLSDPNFDVLSLSAQLYWRRDKLEGIEQQTASIRKKIGPVFEDILAGVMTNNSLEALGKELKINLTVQEQTIATISKKLQTKFPKTKWETITQMAVGIVNTINFYKEQGLDQDIIKVLSQDFAEYAAQNFRNQNIEKIIDEGWHVSQAWAGATLSLSKLFTGRFITGSLVMTKYTDATYEENQASLQKAVDGMNNINNFLVINKAKDLREKIWIINDLLWKPVLDASNVLVEKEEWWERSGHLELSEKAFDGDMKVFCHPNLAPYIHIENWKIKLPHNADISLGKILHQGKETRTLILGARSANLCKEVVLTPQGSTKKLERKDGDTPVKFAEHALNKYNVETKIVAESLDVTLDSNVNESLVSYLEKNGDALVNFRFSNQYKSFINYIKQNSERGSGFADGAKQLLPNDLLNIKDSQWKPVSFTIDDIRFIYASLSRVSQTRDKQLTGQELETKAKSYLEGITNLSKENRGTLDGYISKVKDGTILDDAEWNKMRGILNVPSKGWHYYNANTPALKLFHILTPVKKLAEARTQAYEMRIEKEYASFPKAIDLIKSARNESLGKLQWKPTATWAMKSERIGAVAGYDSQDQVDDKFVGSPKLISGSEVMISWEGLKEVKKHYLTELSSDDKGQFSAFKTKIVDALNSSSKKEDKELASKLSTMEASQFIDALLEDNSSVNFDMQYWFFADCVNETILLGNIRVNISKEEQIPAPSEVYYYDAVVTNDAVTVAKNVWIGVIGGEVKDNKTTWWGGTILDVQWGWETHPIGDLDELKGKDIKIVEGTPTLTHDGKTYSLQNIEMGDGTNWVVAYDAGSPLSPYYQVFTDSQGNITLYPIDENYNAIIPKNTNPVNWTNKVIPESSLNQGSIFPQVAQLMDLIKVTPNGQRIKLNKNKK